MTWEEEVKNEWDAMKTAQEALASLSFLSCLCPQYVEYFDVVKNAALDPKVRGAIKKGVPFAEEMEREGRELLKKVGKNNSSLPTLALKMAKKSGVL
tara:strand:- start:151 stop:441 length:291 start_codon:yes stop_codon:yes gene_type:complete